MQILSQTNFNFIKWRWHAIALSAVVIIAGIGQIIAQGGPRLGVEFAGGTSMVLRFQQPVAEDAVRKSKFNPVIVEGKPVKANGFINFNFKLNN